ncbi:MAG: F0F1 ATP synthase subunit delta [Fimbriiglobus sp.]|jgi:F-type H+-transporting ATPase subunit delta|nr:F0F1 ATP synthase subunit delta [Fimbriiglobus sp.]
MSDATHETVLEATGARARLARVYAEALLALAQAEQKADDIATELHTVAIDVIAKNPAIAAFLDNPAITAKAKLPILGAAFGDASDLFKKFLHVLTQNNRLGLLRDVSAAYQAIRDQQAGRVRVLVRSAAALNDQQKAELTTTLADKLNKQPVLTVRVEPELLGGLIVQVGDRVYDSSVRTRLNNLRNTLMASSSHGA